MVPELSEIRSHDSENYTALAELPWVRDGISAFQRYAVSAAESNAVDHLTEAALLDEKIFYGLLEKSWVRDEITVDEASAIEELVKIARGQWSNADGQWSIGEGNPESALRILEMQFLDTFETLDYYAVRSLGFLQFVDNRYLDEVLDHPSLREGITDADTLILTGLWRIARYSPENLDNLLLMLNSDDVYWEQRTIQLPLAGETTLRFMRITSGTFRTLDIVEEVIRDQERFMNVAWPSNVTIFNVDSESTPANVQIGIMKLNLGYEEIYPLLAHELAHFYWSIPSTWSKGVILTPFTWIVEGAATFMDQLATGKLDQAPGSSEDTGCSLVETISELDQKSYEEHLDFRGGSLYRSACNYTMGYGIFAALYHTLGDAEFRRGFGSLYLKINHLEHDVECSGVERGICYLREAFIEDASPVFADAASVVIDRWYYGHK